MVVRAVPQGPERSTGRAERPEAAQRGADPLHYALLFVIAISFYLTILLDLMGPWSWALITLALGVVALARRDRTTRILAVYPLVFLLYVALRRLADDGFAPIRVEYAVVLDRALGLGRVPTIVLQDWLSGALAPAEPLLVGVYVSFFFAFVVLAPLLFWADRPGAERMLAAGVVVFLIGLPVHWAVPTAPPWMAAIQGHIGEAPRILHDSWLGEQTTVYELGQDASGNDVSAMPSYHTALTVLIALAVARLGRGWAVLGWAYAAAMGFALVYGAEHWVIDLVAGAGIAVVGWGLAPRLLGRLAADPGMRAPRQKPETVEVT
jgi:membrane-associated phospholipid phosphatase